MGFDPVTNLLDLASTLDGDAVVLTREPGEGGATIDYSLTRVGVDGAVAWKRVVGTFPVAPYSDPSLTVTKNGTIVVLFPMHFDVGSVAGRPLCGGNCGALLRLGPDGEELGEVKELSGVFPGLIVADGDALVLRIDYPPQQVMHVSEAGAVDWVVPRSTTDPNPPHWNGLAADDSHHVYAAGAQGAAGVVQRIEPGGTLDWGTATANGAVHVAASGGQVLVTTSCQSGCSTSLTAFDASGATRWVVSSPGTRVAVDDIGNAYTFGSDSWWGVDSFDSTGKERWKWPEPGRSNTQSQQGTCALLLAVRAPDDFYVASTACAAAQAQLGAGSGGWLLSRVQPAR